MPKVLSVERVPYEGWLYSLDVDEDRSFVANGLVVHNCSTPVNQDANFAVLSKAFDEVGEYAKSAFCRGGECPVNPLQAAAILKAEGRTFRWSRPSVTGMLGAGDLLDAAASGDWDEDLHPRDEGGQFSETEGSGAGTRGPGGGGGPVRYKRFTVRVIGESDERAFDGSQRSVERTLDKAQTGELGQAILMAYLGHAHGVESVPFNERDPHSPMDFRVGDVVVEAKAGLVSNSRDAQRWRVTLGEPGPAEKRMIAAMNPSERAAWNARKGEDAIARKRRALDDASEAVGRSLSMRTMTAIIDPDREIADIFEFDDVHPRIGWNSEAARKGYVGSVRYGAA
jgi:hypothetical protein